MRNSRRYTSKTLARTLTCLMGAHAQFKKIYQRIPKVARLPKIYEGPERDSVFKHYLKTVEGTL